MTTFKLIYLFLYFMWYVLVLLERWVLKNLKIGSLETIQINNQIESIHPKFRWTKELYMKKFWVSWQSS